MDEKTDRQKTELEALLARHLDRVVAPEALWHRFQNASYPQTSGSGRHVLWRLATVLFVAILVWGFHVHCDGRFAHALLVQFWAKVPDHLAFRSTEAAKIRGWVRAQAGLDIPLSDEPSGKVRLIGAQLVKGPVTTAAIAYQVNQQEAMLLVSRTASQFLNDKGHHLWTEQREASKRITSWTMKDQYYRLAYTSPGDFREACGVCHNHVERLTALN